MKDEIKEILEDLRTYKDRYEYFLFNNLSFSDRDYKAKILLDYITNLQVENKFAKEYEKQYRIAKSRNEKAIEYIKNDLIPYGDEWHWDDGCISYMVDDVLNILQGDDNE